MLTLSDAANIGAADSQHTYYMYLTLTGNVNAVAPVPVPDALDLGGPRGKYKTTGLAVTSVPVPATAWLFGSGLLGLVGVARRKHT
jgi:hypothetical protein